MTSPEGDRQSFIGELLTRHPGRRTSWPGENLLTEATAAVLRRVPYVAADVAAAMLDRVLEGSEPPREVEIVTQHHVAGVGTPDLVLSAPDHLVWVEAKDWARESGDQLLRYRQALQEQQVRYTALVYLTRTGAAPPSVPGAYAWRWADLAKVITDSREQHADGLDAVQHWIIEDYLVYLRERGLAMTEALEAEFTKVLRDFAAVVEKLRVLRGMVSDQLRDAGWHQVGEGFGKTSDDWGDWWVAYTPDPESAYADCAFDWGMLNLTSGQDPVFIAGLWFGDSWDRDTHRAWIERMTAVKDNEHLAPFEDPSTFDGERLCRSIPLAELPHVQLADQAEAMASFALETYELLRANPPHAM